jgi:hypothetical protein
VAGWHGSEFRNKLPQTGAARSAPCVGLLHSAAGYQDVPDHDKSPSVQLCHRAVPPPLEGHAVSGAGLSGLRGSPSLGDASWPLLKRILVSRQQNWSMGCLSLCPASLHISAAKPRPDVFMQQLQSHLPCVADHSGQCAGSPTPLPALQKVTFLYLRAPLLSPGLLPAYCSPHPIQLQVLSNRGWQQATGCVRRQHQATSGAYPHLGVYGALPR